MSPKKYYLLFLIPFIAVIYGCNPLSDSTPNSTNSNEQSSKTVVDRQYSLGGQIIGLSGTLKLSNSGGDVEILRNGSFAFPVGVDEGHAYDVSIIEQPVNQKCQVLNSKGTVNHNDVSSLVVVCTNFSEIKTVAPVDSTTSSSGGTDTSSATSHSPPTAQINFSGNANIVAGQQIDLNASSSSSTGNQALQYHWSFSQLPVGSKSAINGDTRANANFTPDVPGTYEVRLIVNDGKNDSDPALKQFIVVNSRPIARIGFSPLTGFMTGSPITLNAGQSSDADNQPLTYQWTYFQRPQGSNAVIYNDTSADASFSPDVPGTYEIRLIVRDGIDYSSPATQQFLVNAPQLNTPPIAQFKVISTTNYYTGNQIDLDGTSSTDAENNALQFEWSFANKPTTSTIQIINANSSLSNFTPDVAGSYEVKLIVRDATLTSTPILKTFVVNKTPSVNGGTIVFSNDFNSAIPAQINPGTGTLVDSQGYASLGPDGYKFGNTFLRSATSNIVSLTLNNLPTHTHLSLDFLFAAIDSLDGTGTYPAGDFFNVKVDGISIFRESFANAMPTQIQSYVAPPGGELKRHADLGFNGPGGYYTDSAYDFSVDSRFEDIPHTASSVTITFQMEGTGLQDINDESWAMDNLIVSVKNVVATPTMTFTTPTVNLGYGLQSGPYSVRLSVSNHGGTTVRVESSDPNKVLITPNAITEGTPYLDITIPNGSNTANYYVAALDEVLGNVSIAASANNFASTTANVNVVMPAVMIQDLPATMSAVAPNDIFFATIGVPDATNTRVQQSQFVRIGGNPVNVNFSNNNANTAQLVLNSVAAQSQTVTIPIGQYQTSASTDGIYFDPLDQGSTIVSAQAREYIRTTAANQNVSIALGQITTVYGNSISIGKDLQVFHGFTLTPAPTSSVTATISSDNNNVSLVSEANRDLTGTQSISFTGTGQSRTYYIQGRDFGQSSATSTVTVTVPGYQSLQIPVTVTPAGFWITNPTTITTTSTSINSSFVIQPIRLFPDTFAYAGSQIVRGGIKPVINFTWSNRAVGNIVLPSARQTPITSVIFQSSDSPSNRTFEFDPIAPGKTIISIDTPTGFSTPMTIDTQTGGMVPANQALNVTVN